MCSDFVQQEYGRFPPAFCNKPGMSEDQADQKRFLFSRRGLGRALFPGAKIKDGIFVIRSVRGPLRRGIDITIRL